MQRVVTCSDTGKPEVLRTCAGCGAVTLRLFDGRCLACAQARLGQLSNGDLAEVLAKTVADA
jgi:hypothetical protein